MARSRFFSISQSRQDLNRVVHIMNILVKFQLGRFVDRARAGERLPIRISKVKPPPEIIYKPPQERVKMMFEELGTTFVKFGQLLGTRSDIIGVDYAAELSKLNDSMKPFPTEQAKRIVTDELGKPIGELFSSFESEPMASASVAQVHRARLKSGERVVVKIQRPGIEETIKEDVRIMQYLAHLASKNIPESRQYDPQYLVDEFNRSIMKELDFQREAKNASRLRENFKGDKGIYIPIVYEELCTKHVLTMEEITGTRLADVLSSHSKKFDKELIFHRYVQAFLKMVLVDGFYHADPHPGNVLIMNHNVICFLDYGRVGTIDKEVAENIFRLALFAVNDDVNGLVSHLVRTNLISESDDMNSFKADISDLLDEYYSTQLKDIKMGHMLSDLVSVMSKYEFNRPRELAELTRALLILEGVGMQIDPDLNIAGEFEPYAKKVLSEGTDPRRIADILKNSLLDLEYAIKDFPGAMRKFVSKLEAGQLKIEVEHKALDILTDDLDRVTDKMSISLIVSAMIVGSSIIVQTHNIIGFLGFVVSAALGLWLVLKTLLS